MARLDLGENQKFKRLALALNSLCCGMGAQLARGLLETLWNAAYERADDFLGDADDVEISADWKGARGDLVKLLAHVPAGKAAGFIEFDESRGGYVVHDLEMHAPAWVKKKMATAAARKAAGKTLSDVRREAASGSKTTVAIQTAISLPANDEQTDNQLPAKFGYGTGRDGTGREEEKGDSPALHLRPVRRQGSADAPAAVLAALNTARIRVLPRARPLGATPENLRHITDRLKHNSLDDCLHVIAVVAENVEADPTAAQWFDAVTPFRPDNFARNLARQRASPAAAGGASEYQPCTATPAEIAEAEERDRIQGQQFLAGLRSTP